MKLDSIDIGKAMEDAEALLDTMEEGSPIKTTLKLLLTINKLLLDRLSLDSRTSSKPPSTDAFKKIEKKEKPPSARPSGGQKGHVGCTLKPFDKPDHIEAINVDLSTLPKDDYIEAGYEKRQVVDIKISRSVTEYRAQVVKNKKGQRFVAPFPKGVDRPIQYGASVKAQAVYLSQWQLVPYNRVKEHFVEPYGISISEGTLCNFNKEAYKALDCFEKAAKAVLSASLVLHADETGINIGGKNAWLHSLSNQEWTLFVPHLKRGYEAMESIGVLANFKNVLCHDHWKPYYKHNCKHSLCNAHHLRELIRAHEQDGQSWAQKMIDLLLEIRSAVEEAEGVLSKADQEIWTKAYRDLISEAEKECPPPPNPKKKKRGRVKRSKARNLLERLRDYESDTLRFMREEGVPFTNNQGERDIRMTKVQQKISGCFRSLEGAEIFCRVRSYLSTCKKHGLGRSEALTLLFNGTLPDFIQCEVDKIPISAE